MKTTPPRHVVLPVLTERLHKVEPEQQTPFVAQPSAYYAHADHGARTAPQQAIDREVLLEAAWAQIEPKLQDCLLDLVQIELNALAPQLAVRLLDTLKPALRRSLAEMMETGAS